MPMYVDVEDKQQCELLQLKLKSKLLFRASSFTPPSALLSGLGDGTWFCIQGWFCFNQLTEYSLNRFSFRQSAQKYDFQNPKKVCKNVSPLWDSPLQILSEIAAAVLGSRDGGTRLGLPLSSDIEWEAVDQSEARTEADDQSEAGSQSLIPSDGRVLGAGWVPSTQSSQLYQLFRTRLRSCAKTCKNCANLNWGQ